MRPNFVRRAAAPRAFLGRRTSPRTARSLFTPLVVAVLVVASSPSSRATASPAPAATTEATVNGFVKDTAVVPLSNVQVVVSGVNRNALTDERGRFSIEGLAPGVYHLDFVRIGYFAAPEVVTVRATGAPVEVTVIMKVATVPLSTVNVTATPNLAELDALQGARHVHALQRADGLHTGDSRPWLPTT